MIEENKVEERYPEKDYSRSTFSFTLEERNKLMSLDTMVQIGQVAQIMINQFIQSQCLPRVEIKSDPRVGIIYDIPSGKFYVYTPKAKMEQQGKEENVNRVNRPTGK